MKRLALAMTVLGATFLVLPAEAGAPVHPRAVAAAAPVQASAAAPATIRIGRQKSGGGFDVEVLSLDPYIARVLAGEALPGSGPAALEALAIAIRTYAIGNLGRHRADGFDLCDSTHCQVTRAARPETEAAAQATAGQLLLYQGKPATVYYSASCGGRTELPSAVWPGAEDVPYLPSQPDDGCGDGQPWRSEIALNDLRRAFQSAGYKGTLRDLKVLSRDSSGRVSRLGLEGLTPNEASGQDLRVALGGTIGWTHIRSALFDVRRERDSFRFEGKGYGHGVGMCVIGSAKLADRGETAEAILKRYYPGTLISAGRPVQTTLVPDPPRPVPVIIATANATAAAVARPTAAVPPATVLPPPPPSVPAVATSSVAGITIVTSGDDRPEQQALMTLTAGARDEIAGWLNVAPPAQVKLQIHPTTEAYEKATGRQWFTFGSIVGNEIHLAPLRVLNERGLAEATIRRQLVLLMTAPALAKRPAWVREGAALFYANGKKASSSSGRDSCPSDAELTRPVSPGALSTALLRAQVCFSKQIARGRTWRDIR